MSKFKVGMAEKEVDQVDGKARGDEVREGKARQGEARRGKQGEARQGKAVIGEVVYLDESCLRDVVQLDSYVASCHTFTNQI